jgi:hypothetical protein
MDLSKLNMGARVAGISAIVLLVAMFAFGWFRIDSVTADDGQGNVYKHPGSQLVDASDATAEDVTANAWEAFSVIDIFLVIAAIAALALVAVRARGPGSGAAMVAIVTAGFGGLALVLLLYRLISPPDLLDAFGIAVPPTIMVDAEIGRAAGIFIGIAATAAITYGGFQVMTEDVPDRRT